MLLRRAARAGCAAGAGSGNIAKPAVARRLHCDSFAGPTSKLSKAQASEATRLMKRRTGWRRDEKKLLSVSAARSTGSCSRAIWRATSGGTRASERIWSNRLLTTSITR